MTSNLPGPRPRLRWLLLASALLATGCSKPASGGQAAPGGGGKAVAAPVQRWTTFLDPVENAFTMQVPAGWTVQGGARRISAVEIRTGVVMRSPDGAIELFVGDNDVPVFALPNQMMAMAGLREGMNYSPGYGQNFVIASYRSGDAFAASWGPGRLARVCQGAAPTTVRPLPQATRDIDNAYAQYGINTSIRAGEAEFSCRYGGAPGAGYVFAATERIEMGGAGLWNVKVLAGYAARADRAAEASRLLTHAVGSFRVEPRWAAQQQGLAANVSGIVAQTNEAVSRSITDSFNTRQASRDRVMAEGARARRGQDLFIDPVEGPRELENRAHQWRLPDGRVVGTDTSDPPVPGARELPRAPR